MILRICGIPEKIVRMIQQGCLLSPLIFLAALDWVSRQALGDNETGIQLTYLAAEVTGLGLCGRHSFGEPEDRPHATEV